MTINNLINRIQATITKAILDMPLQVAIIYVTAFFAIIVCGYLPIGYNTNDDISMMLTTKGVGYFSKPSELVTFSNILYGKYLTFFSTKFSSVNFYTINTYFILLSSEILLVYTILKANKNLGVKLLFLIVNIYFMAIVFTKLQFTITCSIAFIAGLISMLYSTINKKRLLLMLSFLFMCISFLVRFKQSIVVFIFCAPALYFYVRTFGNKMAIKAALYIAFAFILGGALFYNNGYLQKHKYHSEFFESSKKMATLFYDYNVLGRVDVTTRNAFLQKHKISFNDYQLYINCFWVPKSFFNPDLITNSEISTLKHSINRGHYSISKLLADYLQTILFSCLLIIIITNILLAEKNKLRKQIDINIFYALYLIVLSQLFNYYFKPMPLRVSFSLLMALFYVMFFAMEIKNREVNFGKLILGKIFRAAEVFVVATTILFTLKAAAKAVLNHSLFNIANAIILLILLLFIVVYQFLLKKKSTIIIVSTLLCLFIVQRLQSYSINSYTAQKLQKSSFSKIATFNANTNYLVFTSSIHLENIYPFDNFNALKNVHLMPISITSNHPMVLNNSFKFSNHFYEYLLEKNCQLIIDLPQLKYLNYIKIYYQEHYHLSINYSEIKDSNLNMDGIYLYKFSLQ